MRADDDPTTDGRAARIRFAERIRQACLEAARRGYEEAAVAGLCEEGAIEAALGAIEMLELDEVLGREE